VRPAQFFNAAESLPGERRLMLAVLEDALDWATKPVRTVRQQRLRREARAWIASADEVWPFSFRNVCSALGLPAGRIVRRILGDDAPSVSGRHIAGTRPRVSGRAPGQCRAA
jgi:hypothetical protein